MIGLHEEPTMYRLAHEIKIAGFTPSAALTLSSCIFIATDSLAIDIYLTVR